MIRYFNNLGAVTEENVTRMALIVMEVLEKKRSRSKSTISSKYYFNKENGDRKLHARDYSHSSCPQSNVVTFQRMAGTSTEVIRQEDATVLVDTAMEPSSQTIGS